MRSFFLYLLTSICFAENLILSSGVNDFFNSGDGTELSSFNTDHLQLLIQYENTLNEPSFPITEFDTFDVNKKRLVQFEIPNTDAEIIGAVLKLRVLPLSGGIDSEGYGSSDDEISFNAHSLDAQVGAPYYEIGFGVNRTPNSLFDFNWDITDPNMSESIDTGLEVLIDLGDFNTGYYYMYDIFQRPRFNNNIISDINENRYFSFLVSDDTALDFAELNLTLSPSSQDSYVNEAYIPLPVGSPKYYKYNGISYLLFNGNATIVDCDESLSGDIIIPRFINNFEVNCILSKAFKDCVLIESISLPSNDFFIEDLAFENCTALNYIYFSGGLPSEYINNEFLDNLYAENYADIILSNIEQKGIEQIRSELKTAVANNWTGNATFQAYGDVNADSNGDNAITNDEMIDYFVDNFLDISDANTQLEKFYELGKFGGRVQDFLKNSHPNYGSDYGYLWGIIPSGGGQALGDILYDVLTNGAQSAPTGKAISELYNLDRYVDVSTYRTLLQNYDTPQDFIDKEVRTGDLYETLSFENSFYNYFIDNTISIDPANGIFFDITSEDFALTEDGEKLIYDSIPTWLISGLDGQIRDMNTLPGVEISGLAINVFDNKVDGTDNDEVDLQKRAIAKKVYDILVEGVNDPNSDNEFWDALSKVSDFFKYELHESFDYSWMWREYIQPELLLKLDAIVEDEDYLADDSQFIDIDNDDIRDLGYAKYPSNNTYRNFISFYTELGKIIRENYPVRNLDGSLRTEAYDNGYLPSDIYDYEFNVDRFGRPMVDSDTGNVIFREHVLASKFLPLALKDPADWRIWYLPESATHQMINPFLFINDTFEIRVNNNFYSVSEYKGIPVTSSSSVSYIHNIVDSDLDGVSDNSDAFPNDPAENTDTDGDGVGDNSDAFPNDPAENTDTDGDGVGDNSDAFPNDPAENADTDGDGVGDNSDAFPNDPAENTDTDGDGVGDNADLYTNYNDSVILNFISEYNSTHNFFQLEEIQDLRPGSTMIQISGNQATVQIQMEESSDLQTWEDTGTPATMNIPADTDTKFFRFKMAE